jgi:hypothetical protein
MQLLLGGKSAGPWDLRSGEAPLRQATNQGNAGRVACGRHRFLRRRLQRNAARAPRKGTGPGTLAGEGGGEGSPVLEKTPISVPRKQPGP